MLQSPGRPAMRRTKLPISWPPLRRVRHLGMELHGVELALLVGDGRERRALGDADHLEAGRQLRDAVAVAHPHGVALALLPHAVEQRGLAGHLQLGAAELAVVAAFDAAAHLRHHGLLAVADAEHRQAGLEHPVGRARRAELGDAGRAARQDHGLGLEPLQRLLGLVERHDLGVDALLAHAPRDQLRDLAAEIDDEDGVGHGGSAPRRLLSEKKLVAQAFPIDHRCGEGSSVAAQQTPQLAGFNPAAKSSGGRRSSVVRTFAAVLALTLCWVTSAARAEAPSVARAEIRWAGLYEAQIGATTVQPDTAAGRTNELVNTRKLQATTTVEGRLGVSFGLEYALTASRRARTCRSPSSSTCPRRGCAIRPRPSARIASSGAPAPKPIGGSNIVGYTFEHAWEVVPGLWIFEIWSQRPEARRAIVLRRWPSGRPRPRRTSPAVCAVRFSTRHPGTRFSAYPGPDTNAALWSRL